MRSMVAGTVDIDVNLVAGTQDIIIGNRYIDIGFKTEHPRPKDVMTENLPSASIMPGGRLAFRARSACLLPVVYPWLNFIVVFLFPHFSTLLLHMQLLHVALYALQLVSCSTARQKFIGDSRGFGALFMTLTDIFRHLYVGQPLCCRGQDCKKQHNGEQPLQQSGKFLHNARNY